MEELTAAQKEAYARARTSVVDLFSFELRHSTFPAPVRMIAYPDDIEVALEADAPANPGETATFTGVAFKAPGETISTEPGNTFTVAVSGISNQVLPYINEANATLEPIAVSVRYVSYDTRLREVIGLSRRAEMQVRSFKNSILTTQMTLGFTSLNMRNLDV